MISQLLLETFRNFDTKRIEFDPGITTIVGPNAIGKTNILEALYLLATGKSFRVRVEEEMIKHTQELARIKGTAGEDELEIILTRGRIGLGTKAPQAVARKRLLVNGVGKRLVDFAGLFRAVMFGPWDLELITDAPSARRRFLDGVLLQTDREYRRALLSYEKGLRQRNKLLERIRDEGVSRSQLLFWDKLLLKNGGYITDAREEFVDFINASQSIDTSQLHLEYDKSIISEARLEAYKHEEVAAATTLVGPHRDDIIFQKDNRDLARYGSRGEQRMTILWVKLAEITFLESKTGSRPTLLLDDIFSELDHTHRDLVNDLAAKQQTIITTAEEHFIIGDNKVLYLK